jgi:phage terminase large subunit
MIELNDVIDSGEFFLASYVDEYEEQAFSFQLKCNRIYQLDFSVVDELEELEEIDPDSNIWIVELEVVSLNKKKFESSELTSRLKLVDEEGCEFDVVEDSHLCSYSDFSKQSKLHKFHYVDLKPKIVKSGALAFELPDYFENLSLSIENGSIEPI